MSKLFEQSLIDARHPRKDLPHVTLQDRQVTPVGRVVVPTLLILIHRVAERTDLHPLFRLPGPLDRPHRCGNDQAEQDPDDHDDHHDLDEREPASDYQTSRRAVR